MENHSEEHSELGCVCNIQRFNSNWTEKSSQSAKSLNTCWSTSPDSDSTLLVTVTGPSGTLLSAALMSSLCWRHTVLATIDIVSLINNAICKRLLVLSQKVAYPKLCFCSSLIKMNRLTKRDCWAFSSTTLLARRALLGGKMSLNFRCRFRSRFPLLLNAWFWWQNTHTCLSLM